MSTSRACLPLLLAVAAAACGNEETVNPLLTGTTGPGGAGGAGSGGSDGGGGAPTGPLGRVFEKTPDDGPAVDRPLVHLPAGSTTLDGDLFKLRSCTVEDCLRNPEALAQADAAGDFLFDAMLNPPSSEDPAAEVNAYYHLERFAERFSALDFPPPDPPLHVVVGFTLEEGGDFFAGATELLGSPGILMGIVGSRNLAYDPDVFGHELMHIYQAKGTIGLDAFLAPTGLNPLGRATGEGTADYFSCSIMDDPDVGEYSAAGIGAPYLSSVANDAICPDDLIGEPHADGQILSGALWEIREQVGADIADAAVRDTLLGLPRGATWAELTDLLRGSLAAAVSAGELADIDAVLAARGLPTCESLVYLVSGESRAIWVFQYEELLDPVNGEMLDWEQYPSAVQLAIDVPSGATTVTVELTVQPDEVALEDLVVHVGIGGPVVWSAVDGELTVSQDATFSAASPIVLPAEPATFYFSVASDGGDEPGIVGVRATIE